MPMKQGNAVFHASCVRKIQTERFLSGFLSLFFLREVPRGVQSSFFLPLLRPRPKSNEEDKDENEHRQPKIPVDSSQQHGQCVTHIRSDSVVL